MATQLKLRRGTTAEHASFTGAEGEITLDTTKDTIVVHDNYTAGGRPLLREDLNNLAAGAVGIDKISIAGGAANQALKINAAGNALEYGSGGGILHTHHFQDATYNITFSATQTATPLTFTITKQHQSSILLVNGFVPNHIQQSYIAGMFLEVGGTRSYDAAHFMSPESGATSDWPMRATLLQGAFTGISAGSVTIGVGWSARDSTNQNPATYWNPQNLSARMRQSTTQVTIWEVESSAYTYYT